MKWYELLLLSLKAISYVLKSKSHHSQPSGKEIYNYPSLNLAFDLTRERLIAQKERLNALDLKANFALTAATGLVSAGLVLQSLLLPHSHQVCSVLFPHYLHDLPLLLKRALPLLPLLITYLVVMIIGFFAYKTRTLIQVPKPDTFLKDLGEPEYYTKVVLFSTMLDAYKKNVQELNKKALFIDWAIASLVIEAFMLVLLLLYQGIC